MESFEVPRWEQATADFAQEFERGYKEAKAALKAGDEDRDGDSSLVFYVDVRRDNVVGGEHGQHMPWFYAAGWEAGIARRRSGEATMSLVHGPDSPEATSTNQLRWVVRLNR
ncbi:hypothetical protein [Chondromyces crocatus]|uniref:Uncharacterized protein n=1 Tax=Chondromyces crocatus TaxID=52 RepID=A0A0K1ELB2_CHOCO|nr:hypothetical protein [Chondromyces crocatus]AKT41403.1 uncharacterized protein CMC5_056030 [Chondromyces crocatus]